MLLSISTKMKHPKQGRGDDTEFKHPHFISADGVRNRLRVADFGNHRIVVMDLNGNWISTFGSKGSGDKEFHYPTGIACEEGDDRLYITDR